jgi:transposase-like protein
LSINQFDQEFQQGSEQAFAADTDVMHELKEPQHGLPDKVTMDKSGANTAAIEALQKETGHAIEMRQNKYLNN